MIGSNKKVSESFCMEALKNADNERGKASMNLVLLAKRFIKTTYELYKAINPRKGKIKNLFSTPK